MSLRWVFRHRFPLRLSIFDYAHRCEYLFLSSRKPLEYIQTIPKPSAKLDKRRRMPLVFPSLTFKM